MKIKIQITIESDEGKPKALQEVAQLNRGSLRPESLGLTLAEARSILAGIEQTVVERQAAELLHNSGSALLAARSVPTKVATRLSFARRLAS